MSLKDIREKNSKDLLKKIDMKKATKIAKENTKYNEWREDNEWNRDYDEKYKSGNVAKALENGFKEIKEHKQGKRKLKTLKECEEIWKKWSGE